MCDAEYLEVARNDPVWQEIVASMKISGFTLDYKTEILAGKMIAGSISFSELVQRLQMHAKSLANGSQTPTSSFQPLAPYSNNIEPAGCRNCPTDR